MAPPLPQIARCAPLFLLACLALPGLAGVAPPAGEIALRDCLVLPPVGRGGRAPAHVDPVEARIVGGQWTPPEVGDSVQAPGGASREWQTARAGADGWLQDRALAGGYAS